MVDEPEQSYETCCSKVQHQFITRPITVPADGKYQPGLRITMPNFAPAYLSQDTCPEREAGAHL